MIGARVLTLDGGSFEVREETPRLWVAHEMGSYGVRNRWRFPKNGGDVREARNERNRTTALFLTEAARQQALANRAEKVWVRAHRHRISKAVETCADAEVLRQVAALVGYKSEE